MVMVHRRLAQGRAFVVRKQCSAQGRYKLRFEGRGPARKYDDVSDFQLGRERKVVRVLVRRGVARRRALRRSGVNSVRGRYKLSFEGQGPAGGNEDVVDFHLIRSVRRRGPTAQ